MTRRNPEAALTLLLLCVALPFARAATSDRNLNGAHTRRVDAGCTLYVAPHGRDAHRGRRADDALKTPARAVASAAPGDVVCFDRGTYPPLEVSGVKATADAPLVFRTTPGAERAATFGTGSLQYGNAVYVEDSDHVHLYDLRATGSQAGIRVASSSNVRLDGLLVEGLGQEAIAVSRKRARHGTERFMGPASDHIDVIGNLVRDTGLVTARYGEGIYVGTGGFDGDDTHDVFVGYNTIEGVRAEAIELKAGTTDVIVRGNLVDGGSHFFHAAITVAIKPVDVPDGNYLIEDNRIFGFASTGDPVAGIGVGHGTTIVRNNLIWGIVGGSGIVTYTTFANPAARRVVLENNVLWNPQGGPAIALHDGDGRTGVTDRPGDVTLVGNVTNDGSAGSLQIDEGRFVGPVTGSADAGRGPGSGFVSIEGP